MLRCKIVSYFLITMSLVLIIHLKLHNCHSIQRRAGKTGLVKCVPRDANTKKVLHRLGKTRFYIRDVGSAKKVTKYDPTDGLDALKLSWKEGNKKCRLYSKDLRMARDLNKISTNAIITKGLEDAADRLNLGETVYWIDAKFDYDSDAYYWGNELKDVVEYGNFFYQQPRPIAIGAHTGSSNTKNPYGSKEVYNRDSDYAQCLAFELPWKNLPEFDSGNEMYASGWQASWNERTCLGKTHRRVLCESLDPACEGNKSKDPHVLTEGTQRYFILLTDKEYYFTEGNWIFANRRFIVNWKPRQRKMAKAYCKKHKMELFTPLPSDECLIPYLKLWAPVLSVYNFWTDYMYDEEKQVFSHNGAIIQEGANVKHQSNYTFRTSRSDKFDQHLCTVYQWVYEFKNETRCKVIDCDWMSYMLAPASCQTYVGTICEHVPADNTRVCDFNRAWLSATNQAVESTAVVEFGYKGSGFWRSTYKQTFGSRICGGDANSKRQMIDWETEYWKVDPAAVEYTYDYEETYWVIDEQLFRNIGKEGKLCSVSTVTIDSSNKAYQRELKKVDCNEWHFYLCESVM